MSIQTNFFVDLGVVLTAILILFLSLSAGSLLNFMLFISDFTLLCLLSVELIKLKEEKCQKKKLRI